MTPKQPSKGKKTNVTIKGDIADSTVITGDNNKVEIHTNNKQERKIASDISKANELLDTGQLIAAEKIIVQVESLKVDFPGLGAVQKRLETAKRKQRCRLYGYASAFLIIILMMGGNLVKREKEMQCNTGEKYYKTGVLAINLQQTGDESLLWVGDANNGLTIRSLDGKSPIQAFGRDKLQTSSIITLEYDRQRKGMWMGSGGGGLIFMDAAQNIKRFTLKDGIPGCKITDIVITQKGIYITAIAGKGMGFSENGSNWVTYEIPKEYKETEQFDIYSAASDQEGSIWVGTQQDVYKWDGANWKHYQAEENSYSTVQSIAVGSDSVKWVGTIDGLYLLDTRAGTQWSRLFTVQDGLTSNNITSITLMDKNNSLVGTEKGLNLCQRKGEELEIICKTISKDTKLGPINTIASSTEPNLFYVGSTINEPIIISIE